MKVTLSILFVSILLNTIINLIATNGHGFIPRNRKWELITSITAMIYFIQCFFILFGGIVYFLVDVVNNF